MHSSCYKKIKAPKTARKFYEEEEDGIGGHPLVEALHALSPKLARREEGEKKGVVRETIRERQERERIKVTMIIIEIVIILVIIEATGDGSSNLFHGGSTVVAGILG